MENTIKKINSTITKTELVRFGKFLLVGFSGTLVDFMLFFFLIFLGLSTLYANILSYSSGIINNFFWNHLWTFKTNNNKPFNTFAKFLLVSLVCMALNTGGTVFLEMPFSKLRGNANSAAMLAKLAATGLVIIWNYLMNRFWAFKPKVNRENHD